ncbi:kynurenine aminotransferase [Leptinotarsa decemlineata]|uniref:kynurenine aminotransferase n=1 Tax=Leptinotarsa decemlineata TaxID=7539 RepID=UPI003D305578
MAVSKLLSNSTIKLFQVNNALAVCARSLSTSQVRFSERERIEKKFVLPQRYAGTGESVWNEYAQLAADYKPINLGQGFPDFPPPKYIMQTLSEVSGGENYMIHQYTRGYGHPRLVSALAKLYTKMLGREINPNTEVITTTGAYEALFCAIMGHVDIGDEVILIEPFFDCCEPIVQYAGGKTRCIPLRMREVQGRIPTSADWVLDKKELEGLFNEKTKVIVLNSPNNPLGKVFTEEEMTHIADLCKKWNVLCISDEVYEWLVYKPKKHIRMASLPGMWDRTITIGSAGKTFSITGWKTGWAYSPENLMVNLQMVHQNSTYTGITPIQESIAIAFEKELDRFDSDDCYFKSLMRELESKRDYLAEILADVGMRPVIPDGGYFILADWTPLASKIDLSKEKDQYMDFRFTKWMTKNVGLQGIPSSVFFGEKNKAIGENFVRYCFTKRDEVLKEVSKVLQKWKSQQS